jgi:hypothetical protein
VLNFPRESPTPFVEFLAQRRTPISGNNSPSSNRYFDPDVSPFNNEIPPFYSHMSRRLDGLEDKNTGLRATFVLAKQSHMCYKIQPQRGDLEEDFDDGAAM